MKRLTERLGLYAKPLRRSDSPHDRSVRKRLMERLDPYGKPGGTVLTGRAGVPLQG